MSLAVFVDCSMVGCAFVNAKLTSARFQCCDMRDAVLIGASMRWANIRKCNMSRASMNSVVADYADIRGCILDGAILRRASLVAASLQDTKLHGAYIVGADLRDADLDYSELPLHCGGSRFIAGARLLRQLAAHIATMAYVGKGESEDNVPEDIKELLAVCQRVGARSHRAADLNI